MGYNSSLCCTTCAGNADPADDHVCTSGSLIASAASVAGSSDLLCCDCPLCSDTQAMLGFKAGGDLYNELGSLDPATSPCGVGWDSHGEGWAGVRNHQASNNMKAMEIGDLAFFYHSVNEKQIVGIVEVCETYHPDPTDASGRFGT